MNNDTSICGGGVVAFLWLLLCVIHFCLCQSLDEIIITDPITSHNEQHPTLVHCYIHIASFQTKVWYVKLLGDLPEICQKNLVALRISTGVLPVEVERCPKTAQFLRFKLAGLIW
jgi:hypothetical protein